jgi:hypothetical protein
LAKSCVMSSSCVGARQKSAPRRSFNRNSYTHTHTHTHTVASQSRMRSCAVSVVSCRVCDGKVGDGPQARTIPSGRSVSKWRRRAAAASAASARLHAEETPILDSCGARCVCGVRCAACGECGACVLVCVHHTYAAHFAVNERGELLNGPHAHRQQRIDATPGLPK